MTKKAQSLPSDVAQAVWRAALRGDRDAFQATVQPYLGELLEAAQRELRYRIALGDLSADDLTAEELLGETLVRAWRDRHRRPPLLGLKVWLLALLFRVAENIARRESRFKKLATVRLEERLPPEPIYDDDESFWEWYQPDELTRWEDVVTESSSDPAEVVAASEELTRSLEPRMHQVFVMHDIYRVPLRDVAWALGISASDASQLLAAARSVVASKGAGP